MKIFYTIILAILWAFTTTAQVTLLSEDFTSDPATTPYPYKVTFSGNLSLAPASGSVSSGLNGRYLTQTGNGMSSSTIRAVVDASNYKNIVITWYDREMVGPNAKPVTKSFSYAIGNGTPVEVVPFTSTESGWVKNTVILQSPANNKDAINLAWSIIRLEGNSNFLDFDALSVTGLYSPITITPVSLLLEATPEVESIAKQYVMSVSKYLPSDVSITAPEHFTISDNGTDFSQNLTVSKDISSSTIYVKYLRPAKPAEMTDAQYSSVEHYGVILHGSGDIEAYLSLAGLDPTPAAPFPVELATFNGQAANGTTTLLWTTASEKNNKKFIVERSEDGEIFTAIGEVRGSGNSATKRNYSFTDSEPANGINYYRLHQVDFDGTESFSNVVALQVAGSIEATVYPTVATREVNISLPDAERGRSITVTDATGRPVATFNNTTEREINLPLENLRSGLYFVRITDGQNQQVQRFIKQ